MKQNQYDPVEQKFQAIETEADLAGSSVKPANEIMSGVSAMWYGELAKLDIPAPTWVVDRLIPDESISIISAPPNQLKTWLVYDAAIQIALGRPLFGHFKTKQTNVLIVDEENGPGLLRERLIMLGVTDDTPIAIASKTDFKITEASAKALIAYCEAKDIGLVIFDSFTRFHNADENNAQAMAAVMADFGRLTSAGLAVLLIHHNRKPAFGRPGGANEMRGSGDILAACNVQISMRCDGNSGVVKVTQNKNRNAEEIPAFSLELLSDDNRCWFEYRGNEPKRADKSEHTDNAIRELLADRGEQFQQQIVEALKGVEGVGGGSMIADRLKALHEAGELTRKVGANGKHIYALRSEQPDE